MRWSRQRAYQRRRHGGRGQGAYIRIHGRFAMISSAEIGQKAEEDTVSAMFLPSNPENPGYRYPCQRKQPPKNPNGIRCKSYNPGADRSAKYGRSKRGLDPPERALISRYISENNLREHFGKVCGLIALSLLFLLIFKDFFHEPPAADPH